ncbi:MAG: xanthine dehydrogenase family protein subunit M [Bryobacteraceae bacterium]|nr:xanthine dehydrogenase family protein subunit M [Bryobacteraceae bacterium]
MIPQNFDYATPESLEEAFRLLSDPNAKVLAGGQSLIPMMRLRLAAPETLVDLRGVPGLGGIRLEGRTLRVGAMVTHYELESSPLVRKSCPLLAEAAANIGDVQVRNCGTIGGSLAHADPAADYPASLHALEASVRIASPSGERTVSIADFLVDTFTTALEPGELVVEVSVPVEAEGAGVSYQKCVQPASGFAIVGVAARIVKKDGEIAFARIGVTGLSGNAFRATGVEKLLEGTRGDASDIGRAVAGIGDGVDANNDIHASAAYRQHLARVYAARAIVAAVSRAK